MGQSRKFEVIEYFERQEQKSADKHEEVVIVGRIEWRDYCMWEDRQYCWVVICKNRWYHVRQNLFFGHRILLGETDSVTPLPALNGRFTVRCDDCRKEYSYKPEEVRRFDQELPESFTPHPLFR